MRCRWTSTWRWSVLWFFLVLRSILTVTLGFCCSSCNEVNPGKIFPLKFHWLTINFVHSFVFWWTFELTLISLPMQYLTVGSRSPFQGIIQNPRIRRPLCARDWWLLHHQPKMNIFHEECSQLIVLIPWISTDCSVMNFSDMSNIYFIVRSSVFLMWMQECLSNSPWIQMLAM